MASILGNKSVNLMDIVEWDPVEMEERLSFMKYDLHQLCADKKKENAAIREEVMRQNPGYKLEMRSEVRRLQSFLSYTSFSTWCPKKMASAGFFFTGVKSSVQCFCCGLVLCTSSLRTSPYENHVKHNPACGFIQGKDVGNIPKYEVRVQLPENDQVDLQEYVREESRLMSFASWPCYAGIIPAELASAGFFYAGKKDTVQCFSCGGCLGLWQEKDDPWKEHAKWFPECCFLQSKKSPSEIKQYIKSYSGFAGYTGKHFMTILRGEIFPKETRSTSLGIFENEEVRFDSFKEWPENAQADPAALAKAGFYYTGISDSVKCFTCGICLHLFEPGDDPLEEHQKHSPKCEFLHTLTNPTVSETKQEKKVDKEQVEIFCECEAQCSNRTGAGLNYLSGHWFLEEAKLKRKLMEMYNSLSFRKCPLFPESSHFSMDLKSLFADISVVLKDTRNQPVQQLTLPDILSVLSDITMIEGAAGSGKTALLRKIAILWASGTCPVLSRFSLVFYISVLATENHQTLSEIISKQLLGSTKPLMEGTLEEIIERLGNQVLFLVDDYGEMNPGPGAIEKLLLNNHINRVSLAVTVCTGKGRKLRHYAKTELGIQDFPLYSSLYVYRQLFVHDITFLEVFVVTLSASNILKAALTTPLFAFALCIYWVENPKDNTSLDITICKAYLKHNMLRHSKEIDRVEAVVSSCGELALKGLFNSQFNFTDEDLCAAGINCDHALKFGFLSKFTSQRLSPIYSFFHPTFMEFLSSKRISKLLESLDEVEAAKGLSLLLQIDNFLKFAARYTFLKYCCIHSTKTSLIIISHLFELLNKRTAFDYEEDIKLPLNLPPELAWRVDMLTTLHSTRADLHLSFVIDMLLIFANEVAEEGNCMAECSPIILQFIERKDIALDLSYPNERILTFLSKYPEGFSLINSLQLSALEITVNKDDREEHPPIQVIDKAYSSAFVLYDDEARKMDVKNYFLRNKVNFSKFGFNQSHHKIAVLRLDIRGEIIVEENVQNNLFVFFLLSHHIELNLKKCPEFVRNISSCIEQHKNSFVKCTISNVELSLEEQKLITQMASLQSLQITGNAPQEYILSHLDKFKQLKELIVDLSGFWSVFEMMAQGLKKLLCIEKLVFRNINLMHNCSQLAESIATFRNLKTFHLNVDWCPDFETLMAALCKNGKLQDINLYGLFIKDSEMIYLASALPSLTRLKVLNIEGHHFENVEAANIFVKGLPSLIQLEELVLPSGHAVAETVTSIIDQFQYMLNLRRLHLTNNILNNHSLLHLAKASREGYLSNIQKLNLSVNHSITQSGWTEFFQTLDNLQNINELCITRLYTYQFKTNPSTLVALVQCVSRLHSLNTLIMHGWLLDEKDLEMLNSMKQKHPQGKSLIVMWKWILPFKPIVEN
ncbi:baculoviral IAP repeat-containing protein 1-like [Pelodytes ibericus]